VADRLSGRGVGCAPSEDFLDAVSGTLGFAGSVDTVITLKRTRAEGTGALSVTGRDVEEMVYPLTFDDGVRKVDGTDLADAANKVTQRKLSEKMRAVLELVNSGTQTTAADVTAILGITDSTPRQYLRRLADEHGLIDRVSTGTYGPVTVSQVSHDQDHPSSPDEKGADSLDSDEAQGPVDPSQEELALSDA
jgi:hypothetical protein